MTNATDKQTKDIIVLNKLLPKREALNKRYFVNGKWLNTYRVNDLLRKAGHKVTEKMVPIICLATEYKGIKIKCTNGGLMVEPKNQEDFQKLKKELLKDGYFFHSCYLPRK